MLPVLAKPTFKQSKEYLERIPAAAAAAPLISSDPSHAKWPHIIEIVVAFY